MEIICHRCRISKQENEFGVDNKNRSGYRSSCKECEGKKLDEGALKSKVERLAFNSNMNEVAMAPSYSEPQNIYYIFRSAREQITINVLPDGKYRSSHLLEDYERKFIDQKYNLKPKF